MGTATHILIVDDDPFVGEMLAMILEDEKFQVTVAENGGQALEKLQEATDVGLIITDLNMPGMGGLELLERVQSLGLNIPFIILSGGSESDHATAALDRGAVACLVKDEDFPEKIIEVVQQVLGSVQV